MTRASTRKSTVLTKENTETVGLRRSRRVSYKPALDTSSDSDDEFLVPPPAKQTTPRKQKQKSREKTEVTPSKQKKTDCSENDSPGPLTPSTLLNRLDIATPDKSEKRLERKQLFSTPNSYQSARKALHSTLPNSLPGREREVQELNDFIMGHLENETSGSLYISGPPGTGKTASLSIILQQEHVSDCHQIYVNCTAIKSSGTIFSRITKELNLKVNGKTEKEYLSVIEKYLKKPHRKILLVLDEIDQLESKNQSILYTVFEWPSIPNSRLILIGIANSLDLTDRILPRLQARCELKPKLMHFASYTKQQILDIFSSRLKEAGALEVFTPVALQLLAGKVAAVSGDVRRALDIGRRVIELGEQKSTFKSLENLTQDENLKAVEVKHVVDVLNTVYGAAQNLNDDADDTFPLQQKIVVCSLLLMLKNLKNKDVTVGKLHEVYKKVCKKRNLLGVDQTEFVGICVLLETRGIIRIVGKKEPRLNKVSLAWDEEEVAAALKDKQLMSTILQDVSCLRAT